MEYRDTRSPRASIVRDAGLEVAYLVYGVYDLISRVEAETMDHLKDTIGRKIRRLDKVRSTLTMIVYD